ncbi:hypothetical protein ACFL3L_00495 [Candidatus Neomarinimicrobiota bacterium]
MNKNHSFQYNLFYLFLLTVLNCQSLADFDPFDWTLYRQTGEISSISEGYQYIYFGSSEGGILRINKYSNRIEEPITTAQGISTNKILAVHFDQDTGILWAITENGLEFSYSATGNWILIGRENIGLTGEENIWRIGSSNSNLWIDAGHVAIKLDKVAGILQSVQPVPDEIKIKWSSNNAPIINLPANYENYLALNGWILNANNFIGPSGESSKITTYLIDTSNNIWVGTENGTFFNGDKQMETLVPFQTGLRNTNVQALSFNKSLWVAGIINKLSRGITQINLNSLNFDYYDFSTTVNLPAASIYSIDQDNNEIWFGSGVGLITYDKIDKFWRVHSLNSTVINSSITEIEHDSTHIWVGSKRGLGILDRLTKNMSGIDINQNLFQFGITDIHLSGLYAWISTYYNLFRYDIENDKLESYKSIGEVSGLEGIQEFNQTFWEIASKDASIYFGTPYGIISYDRFTEEWEIVVEPSVYKSIRINTMKFVNRFCFIGTDANFMRVDIESGLIRNYTLPFISQVKDMYISGDMIWLATNKGLVRFLWKKDL